MIIHLLRHGRTAPNIEGLFCGSTDVPLSSEGIAELEELISQDIYPKAQIYFTSGLLRAKQTANIIYGDIPMLALDDLDEYNFGIYEMKSFDEIKEDDDLKLWVNDETGVIKCPGGESQQEFVQRVLRGYESVLTLTNEESIKSAMLVFHGGPIVRIMQHLFPEEGIFFNWQPDNGHGYSIDISSDSPVILQKF
ncbi:MAG: histidine phosphatase family protein [Oscillospiraceae bacterium]|nr:histidine phosphatase family protein [Oscillospiraceae bacterium]